jgi:hypothetical protein
MGWLFQIRRQNNRATAQLLTKVTPLAGAVMFG